MIELRAVLQYVAAHKEYTVRCEELSQANNLRQRFYRYRDKIRQNPDDPLLLIVDHLHFRLSGKTLTISYRNPDEILLEGIKNDDAQSETR